MSHHGEDNHPKPSGSGDHTTPTIHSAPLWGWMLLLVVVLIIPVVMVRDGCKKKAEAKAVATLAEAARRAEFTQTNVVEFPITGKGYATNGVGLKIWLDPKKTFVGASRPLKYVFSKDPSLVFEDSNNIWESPSREHRERWLRMPAGEYTLYPKNGEMVYVWWNQ